ncbi:DUF413 domain-containing protein [Shewanella salipaludis]|uniref:Macrodomain Ori protein n=1 Tax=Shewanella salipaludis TaxID=2723052 RepID=A0A972FXG2_9GAMM|nr:DUF413 domain-containing protein [Shewanella salipaludis]NMH63706.1 DUF413 domain-containing protein [Shewanella salipaludis]
MSASSLSPRTPGAETYPHSTQTGFVAHKRFYDDVNFPKGFKRCGDFTNKEAELLETHGQALKDLAEGKRLPCCPDEAQFVQVAQGHLAASSLLEQIWQKYCRLAQGKPFYAVLGTVPAATSKAEGETIYDIEDDAPQDAEPEDN